MAHGLADEQAADVVGDGGQDGDEQQRRGRRRGAAWRWRRSRGHRSRRRRAGWRRSPRAPGGRVPPAPTRYQARMATSAMKPTSGEGERCPASRRRAGGRRRRPGRRRRADSQPDLAEHLEVLDGGQADDRRPPGRVTGRAEHDEHGQPRPRRPRPSADARSAIGHVAVAAGPSPSRRRASSPASSSSRRRRSRSSTHWSSSAQASSARVLGLVGRRAPVVVADLARRPGVGRALLASPVRSSTRSSRSSNPKYSSWLGSAS